MAARELRFADGNVSEVVRVGDTVRRVAGPWTTTVHALLRHLEAVGFEGAPRVLGFDERGREILTFVSGSTIPASLEGFSADAVLVETATLLRRYHDATTTFVPPADAAWWHRPGAPNGGDVICHNDVAPWNTVVVDGQPRALIDWDCAAPGPRIWDIAYALWRFAPLYTDDGPGGEQGDAGPPSERARRMALFCDVYGLDDRRELLRMIEHRQAVMYNTLKLWAEAGIPAFVSMWRSGHADSVLRDIAYFQRHRDVFERSLGV